MRKKVKTRLLQNVYYVEILKMKAEGLSYKAIKKELYKRHRKSFSIGLIFTVCKKF